MVLPLLQLPGGTEVNQLQPALHHENILWLQVQVQDLEVAHPSIAATRLFGLAQGILLQNLKGFDELKKMSRFSK